MHTPDPTPILSFPLRGKGPFAFERVRLAWPFNGKPEAGNAQPNPRAPIPGTLLHTPDTLTCKMAPGLGGLPGGRARPVEAE
jgi:hypothetical protein